MNKSNFKKHLKTLGFKVVKCKHVKSFNAAQYIHLESGQELNFNVFSPELLARWAPLFDFLRSLTLEQKEQIKNELDYVGLFKC